MPRPPLEVADVFRAHARDFLEACGGVVSFAKKKVLRALVACRTAALGGHRYVCSDDVRVRALRLQALREPPLPQVPGRRARRVARGPRRGSPARRVLPRRLHRARRQSPRSRCQNKKVMYDILFRASAETLKQIAADPKHLGAELGFIGLLHTWGQTLQHHPHIHYVVPGGGFGPDGATWVSCRPGFFLPVRVLSRLFRGKFLDLTRRAFDRGRALLPGAARPAGRSRGLRRAPGPDLRHRRGSSTPSRPSAGPLRC